MEATNVDICEFRAGMAEYIVSSTPVAVTRHGQTVGYFIPTQGQVEADVADQYSPGQLRAPQAGYLNSIQRKFKEANGLREGTRPAACRRQIYAETKRLVGVRGFEPPVSTSRT